MGEKKIRWGIIGLGRIAHEFAEGLSFVEDAELQAVASSNRVRAHEFADKYGAPEAYDDYEQLAKSDSVDVVYIASYNSQHYAHTMLCLENGKHVLCEKPSTINPDDTKAMFAFAAEKNLFLMEALWTLFLPSVDYLRAVMQSGELGALKHLTASFGFPAADRESPRLLTPELGGGALYDIGIYPILIALHTLGRPSEIETLKMERGKTGVDIYTEFIFKYPSAQADLSCSFKGCRENTAVFDFENGSVEFGAMWHMPTKVRIKANGDYKDVDLAWEGNGYNYEALFVTKQLQQGKTAQTAVPAGFSIELAGIIEGLLKG